MPQPSGADRYVYERHRPEETPLYRIVETHYPRFLARLEAEGGSLPAFVKREFDDYLKCGLLENGFLRVKCDACSHEHLVAFSCKRRGFCPSCGARRMIESAAHLVDHVLPEQPIRQWVLTFPYPLRFLFAAQPQVLSQVLGVVYRAISTDLLKRTGFTVASGAKTGAVTLIQRFGSAPPTRTGCSSPHPSPTSCCGLEHRLTLACNPSLFQDALARSFRQVSVPPNLSPPRSTTLCRSATTHHPSGLRPSSHSSGGYFFYPLLACDRREARLVETAGGSWRLEKPLCYC